MTICIAAIGSLAEGRIVFCASDRMITAGDTQYEPPHPKTFWISNSIILMPAGDYLLHTAMVNRLNLEMKEFFSEKPSIWPSVYDFADRYRRIYAQMRRQRWERKYLFPEGLDLNNFQQQAETTKNRLVNKITSDLLPSVSALVVGVDSGGAHIFAVYNDDDPEDHTHVGYAAVGLGARHAETQVRQAGHSPWANPNRALWLSFLAKKRSEIAPSVGAIATDLQFLGPQLGQNGVIRNELVDWLHQEYETIRDAELGVIDSAGRKIEELLIRLSQESVPASPTDEPDKKATLDPFFEPNKEEELREGDRKPARSRRVKRGKARNSKPTP